MNEEAIRAAVRFELAYAARCIFLTAYGKTPPSREVIREEARRTERSPLDVLRGR